MKILAAWVPFLLFAAAAASAVEPHSIVTGPGDGPVLDVRVTCPDSNLVVHHDGSFEAGFAWEGAGVVEPYWGCFGEGFDLGPGRVECFSVWITRSAFHPERLTDIYVWEGGVTGEPGNVLGLVAGILFANVPVYPAVGRFDAEIVVPVAGAFTAGSWGDWPGLGLGYWWMVDTNGEPGHPWTHVVPDLGYPEGWQHPSAAFGTAVRSMGIGVHFTPDPPTPAQPASWGSVKRTFVFRG